MIALALLAGVLLALHLATATMALIRYRVTRRRPDMIGTPKVTLVRPVCGVDPFDALALGSSFLQDFPDYEVIFCAPIPDDPAVALVQRLIAAHPDVPARLLIGEAPGFRNPKLRNVSKGWKAAQTDWICVTDSNLLLPPDYLRILCASWGPRTALVSAPPVGVWPTGIAGRLECAFLNTNQARWQLAADSIGAGFAQGKTLFFNRALLDSVGGLKALDRHLAEDVNATKIVRALGRQVTLTPLPFPQPIGQRRLRQVWDRQVRWAQVRREGFPGLYGAELLNGGLVPISAAAGASLLGNGPMILPAAFALLWYGAEFALARGAGWSAGWRDVAVLALRDLLIPAIWTAALLNRTVLWRGTRIQPSGHPGEAPAARLDTI